MAVMHQAEYNTVLGLDYPGVVEEADNALYIFWYMCRGRKPAIFVDYRGGLVSWYRPGSLQMFRFQDLEMRERDNVLLGCNLRGGKTAERVKRRVPPPFSLPRLSRMG